MKNKKLDLKFGAEVKELVVQYEKEEFKSLDGKTYSFEEFKTNPKITKLLTQSFRDIQSTNSNERSKRKTNGHIAFGIRKFLKWIDEINYTGDISHQLLLNYKKYLQKEKSWTAYSSYAIIARNVLSLMEKGNVSKFLLPNNIPLQQAKNSSETGVTIASLIENNLLSLSKDEINEEILSSILNFLWSDSLSLLNKLDEGQKIFSTINSSEYFEYRTGMAKDEAIENIVKNYFIEFKGISDKYLFSKSFQGYDNIKFVNMMKKYVSANKHYKWGIYNDDIYQYFYPTKRLASNILILLASAQINPESAMFLKTDCLQTDINSEIVRVAWNKNRAGGEQISIPFPKGNHEQAKTIPNLLTRYLKYRKNITTFANDDFDDLLFVFKHVTTYGFGVFLNQGRHLIKENLMFFKRSLEQENNPINQMTLNILDKITLSIIRTTSINIAGKRLNRDITKLASMDGRKVHSVLNEHYLNNSETKQFFDSNIRNSQKLLENWVFEKPIVIPEDKDLLQKKLKIDYELSEKIINDEFNNGYGASLINHNVIIIDSTINSLRIIQWLEKLNADKHNVKINNPERWNYVYQPQILLFTEALNLMSKKNKQEAKKLNNDTKLPFPEVL